MKQLLGLLLALFCCVGFIECWNGFRWGFPHQRSMAVPQGEDEYKTYWFDNYLDHFDFQSSPLTYKQRYIIQDKYWQKTGSSSDECPGPIFFYTGNEGDITWFYNNTGFVTKALAPKYGALVIFAEHRYYGLSLPFGSESFQPGKVGYLSSIQALFDYARLLEHLKVTIPGAATCPIISFGGSYGGMLSAWFRLKFPHVVDGAIAASAPILQFPGSGFDQWAFNAITTNDFTKASPQCSSYLKQSMSLVTQLTASPDGLNLLSQTFKLCTPLRNATDGTNFVNWIVGGLQYLAMTDYPYPSNFLEPMPGWPVKVACKDLLNVINQDGTKQITKTKLLDALNAALTVYYNYTGTQSCYNTNSDFSGNLGDMAWDYQSCTEMVMPSPANGTSDMFPPSYWNFTAFTEYCIKTWKVIPRPSWVLNFYGGRNLGEDLKAGSNIVFSNGNLDPWSGGGVTRNLTESLIAVVIKDGAHHLDLRTPNPQDPQSVIDARALEQYYIDQWIAEAKKKRSQK